MRVGMSREEFDKLPPIITRKTFLYATGLDYRALYILVEMGRVRRLFVGRKQKLARYYRDDAAVLAGYVKEKQNGH